MTEKIDKRDRAELFRSRLAQAMQQSGTSQSVLARRVGIDRSTVSQLLSGSGARLPNAHVVGACAAALGVSSDWLLGLSNRPESAQALLAGALELTDAPRALVDEQIFRWHREATGQKIRHVPATLPDIMKTREMLEWEYAPHLGKTAEQAINASADRLALIQAAPSDHEIAVPLHEVESLARAEGYYAGLPADLRDRQLAHMCDLTHRLFPRLRLHLFDARRLFSAPVTVFGAMLAVVYVGQSYLVFRDAERVRAFAEHFDLLVRECDVDARDCAAHLHRLRAGSARGQ